MQAASCLGLAQFGLACLRRVLAQLALPLLGIVRLVWNRLGLDILGLVWLGYNACFGLALFG